MTTLLSRPPQVASRLIALDLLERSRKAAVRLADPNDGDALHDFRVSLRRLRSIARAYRRPLADSLRKKDRRRLSEIARATSPSRDAEVAASWVRQRRSDLAKGERNSADWLADRLENRRGEVIDQVRQRVEEEYLPFAEALQERLAVYTQQVRLGAEAGRTRFGELVGAEVSREMARVEHLLSQVGDASDQDAVHEVRLAGKRLRYLLEPLYPEMAAVGPILGSLKAFQDLLGELNDAYVLERELTAAVEVAARDNARRRLRVALDGVAAINSDSPEDEAGATLAPPDLDGLLALARLNRTRRDRLFGQLASGWLAVEGSDEGGSPVDSALRDLAASVHDLVRWLEAGFSPPPPAVGENAPVIAS